MARYDADPPPRAKIASPARRSPASSDYHDITHAVTGSDLQYPPGFDLNGFEDIILAPVSALTARSSPSPTCPLESDGEEDDEEITAFSSTNTFLERCKNTALTIPTTSVALTPNQRASLQSRAKSIANLVPTWTNRQDTSTSETNSRIESKTKRNTTFGNLFAGSSAPINIGIVPSPDKERASMDWGKDDTIRPSHKRASTALSSSSTSKFSWFGTKTFNPAPTPIPSSTHLPPSDPLLDLNIDAALFPHGPTDRFDPSSYNALLHNAQSTLSRLHTGYRARVAEAETARRELDAQFDEVAEATTRAAHLKQQLDAMAARVAEQDAAMRLLADELAQERLQRREDEEKRARSIRLMRTESQHFDALEKTAVAAGEQEEEATYQAGRRECGDAGFESDADAESVVSSVFSRTNDVSSPSIATPLSTLNEWTPDEDEAVNSERHGKSSRSSMPPAQRASMGQRSSGLVVGLGLGGKRRSGMSVEDYMERRLSSPRQEGCANCQGGSQMNAWTLVAELREEKKGLSGRVAELEQTVDGCLDLVAGLR